MKKWFKRVAIGLVVLLLVISLSARFFLTKEFLVDQIESSINSRVEVGELNVSLFSIPARVTLKDVVLSQRDNYANRKIAYSERPPIKNGVIILDEISFKVSLWELLSKEIYVDHFELKGLHADVVLYEDGTNSLDPLFADPDDDEESSKKKKKKSFNAKSKEEFVTHLKSVHIEDVSFDLLLEKTGLLVSGTNCGVELHDIKVDPNSLEVVNEAKVKMQAQVDVYSSERKSRKLGELGLSGVATAKLFDPISGDIDPNVMLDLDISDSSHISTRVQYLEKVWEYSEKFEKFGVSLGRLPQQATFGRAKKVKGSYYRGRVDLVEDVSLVIADWEAALNAPSWFASGDETHEFFIDLSASGKSSQSIFGHADTLLGMIPREIGDGLGDELKDSLLKNGKLTLSVHTSGELSSPKVEVQNELPDLEKTLKDYGKKKALDFMLKQLK